MSVNVLDLLPEERLKELIEEEIRKSIQATMKNSQYMKWLITESAFKLAEKFIDKAFGMQEEEFYQLLSERIKEMLADKSALRREVFSYRFRDYKQPETLGAEMLVEIIKNSRNEIKEAVRRAIDDEANTEIKQEIRSAVHDVMTSRLTDTAIVRYYQEECQRLADEADTQKGGGA